MTENTFGIGGREIAFRAWNIDNEIVYNAVPGMSDDVYMQYTGLKDKNGKEIYEGDILETNIYDYSCGNIKEKRTTKYLAKFNNWAFRLFDLRYDGEFYTHHTDNTTLPLEVIGNIFENASLLEK